MGQRGSEVGDAGQEDNELLVPGTHRDDPQAASEGVRGFRLLCRRPTPLRPSYPSSSVINSTRRRSMAFKRVVSVLASLLRSANSFWSFFLCRWSCPLLSRTRDSTSCRNSRYHGLPCMLLSRNCNLPTRIAAMISCCVRPNSCRADLSLSVAPFRDHIESPSSMFRISVASLSRIDTPAFCGAGDFLFAIA